jgi:uncharacterized phage infection (PIP) family protein YhgE
MGNVIRTPPAPPPIRVTVNIPSNALDIISNMNNTIKQNQNRINNLNSQLSDILDKINIDTAESNDLKNKIAQLRSQINNLNNEITDLHSLIQLIRKSTDNNVSVLNLTNNQIRILEKHIDELNIENINALESNKQSKKVLFDMIKTQNTKYSEKYDDLRDTLTKGDKLSDYTNSNFQYYNVMNFYLLIIYYFLLAYVIIFVKINIVSTFKILIILFFICYPFIINSLEIFIYELCFFLYSIVIGEPYRKLIM